MKYYLTTPIYYVNDQPHIGHAYTTVAADVISRWKRLCGDEVFFLTGTDEHGAKICQAAEKAGNSPKEFCDIISAEFRQEWANLNITNDYFVRTTDEQHLKAVQKFLSSLKETGAIEKGKYEGLYCVGCEKFLSDSDLIDGCCPDHKQKPVPQSEENWFFRLSDYQAELLKIITDESDPRVKIYPLGRREEIIGKLKALKLENISISRANLEWGVPLPFDPKQTAYVWVDALLNYITAIGYAEDTEQFKKLWPADLHLMAKDILWFHSVIWPAMLLAVKMPLPGKIFAHGFFTINGDKMSKTLGNTILPKEMITKFGVDASRYLLLSLFPFGADGDISWKALTDKYNTDLANNIGNLASRTLTMVDKYFAGAVPDLGDKNLAGVFAAREVLPALKESSAALVSLEFNRTLEKIQAAANLVNQKIETDAPWKMAKENNPKLAETLASCLEAVGLISFYLIPFMPDIAQNIFQSIGGKGRIESAAALFLSGKTPRALEADARVNKGAILFPRILDKK